jgi:L-lactate dehydrogenase complex protein LldF
MINTAGAFARQARDALHDETLQQALARARGGFIDKRRAALDALPEFEELRNAAREIKAHTLDNLADYLEHFEQQVIGNGGHVHWASTPTEATALITGICRQANAQRIAKGKTMVGEEVALNEALQADGMRVIETDLGEYIIQLAGEPPSHIIAPAVHKTRQQIARLFHDHHARLGLDGPLDSVPAIVDEARQVLRDEFLAADVGITGANMLIAETGSTVLVTNEGNGDLTASLPRVHVVVAAVDKVVPTLEDATVLLRLLARSATGQDITSYTSFFSSPRQDGDLDGPEAFHVVLVDNQRSAMLGSDFHDMLYCIRCGACMNHCPVYGAIGGHAYGWVYPGPMGSVLTPLMTSLAESRQLAEASTLCGRCEEVCPVSIPLPRLLRLHRQSAWQQQLVGRRQRLAMHAWRALASRPRLYHRVLDLATLLLRGLAGHRRRLTRLPLASGWTASRDLPAPQGGTFVSAWAGQQRKQKQERR